MAYGNPLKETKLPRGYARFPASYWTAKADEYLALARGASERPGSGSFTRRIQYAMDKRDECLAAAYLIETTR